MKSHTLFTFLGGMMVGSAIALLTSPKSGAELRESIRDRIDRRAEHAARRLREVEEQLAQLLKSDETK
jgi:gas vesicle protein